MCFSAHAGTTVSVDDPVRWLQGKAQELAAELNAQKAVLDASPQALVAFLESRALPLWETDRMARALLGSYWSKATTEQRKRMKAVWRETLVRYFLRAYPYYHGALPEFEPKADCQTTRRCWVHSHLTVQGHGLVDLDFLLLNHRKSGWKVLDVRVAGVSLVAHKKGECLAVANARGLPALLDALASKNRTVEGLEQEKTLLRERDG
jgi:phospholipid transport system substrate-binding protein